MTAKGKRTGTNGKCTQCGAEFYAYPCQTRKYCSRHCATVARNLSAANPAFSRDVSGENNPMYGKGLPGEKNGMYGRRLEKAPRWKGGRKTRKDGYVFVVAPDDHPNPSYIKKNGLRYILEHRYVMEQHIGRYLEPTEVVHHIDENANNNDISNLRLYSNQSEHIADAHRPVKRKG